MTDERLLEKASRGDETAFVELYQRHRSGVFRFAYRLLGTIELAEDITHDCFVGLIKNPLRFDPSRAMLRTYLYAAVRNLAMKHMRSSRRDLAVDELAVEPATPDGAGPLEELLDQEVSNVVRRAIADLPPLQREVLVLFEYEQLSMAEIAEVVTTDVGSVKSRLFRARQSLKKSLAPYMDDAPRVVAVGELCK